MYEKIVYREGNNFYPLKNSEVKEAQENIGITFPKDLRVFYNEIGYGFLKSNEENFNRIMDPGSVSEFRLREGQFANDSELEIYSNYERDKLVFFEVCEGYYLSIGFSKTNNGKIFDGNKEIANNLEQFLMQYQDNERYF